MVKPQRLLRTKRDREVVDSCDHPRPEGRRYVKEKEMNGLQDKGKDRCYIIRGRFELRATGKFWKP